MCEIRGEVFERRWDDGRDTLRDEDPLPVDARAGVGRVVEAEGLRE